MTLGVPGGWELGSGPAELGTWTKRMKTIAYFTELEVFENWLGIPSQLYIYGDVFWPFPTPTAPISSQMFSASLDLVWETSLPPFAFGDRLQSFGPILYCIFSISMILVSVTYSALHCGPFDPGLNYMISFIYRIFRKCDVSKGLKWSCTLLVPLPGEE